MRHLRVTLAAAAALLLAGCGADEPPAAEAPATPTATPTAATGSITLDLRKDPNAWPQLPGGKLRLASSDPVTATLPEKVGPPTRVEAEVVLPARGRAGVFCGQYAAAVAADGAYALYRLAKDGSAETVLDGEVEPGGRSDPGRPTLVRLLCGEGESATVGLMINASPIQFARDANPGSDSDSGRVGAFGIGPGGVARYVAFAASASAR